MRTMEKFLFSPPPSPSSYSLAKNVNVIYNGEDAR